MRRYIIVFAMLVGLSASVVQVGRGFMEALVVN